jgi:hypothetical protein
VSTGSLFFGDVLNEKPKGKRRGGKKRSDPADVLHCLTRDSSDQELDQPRPQRAGWPDGRRKFGTVSGAIMVVRTQTDSEMRLRDINAQVERVLGGRVSFPSVADYLLKRTKGPQPLFLRTRYGHYRLSR